MSAYKRLFVFLRPVFLAMAYCLLVWLCLAAIGILGALSQKLLGGGEDDLFGAALMTTQASIIGGIAVAFLVSLLAFLLSAMMARTNSDWRHSENIAIPTVLTLVILGLVVVAPTEMVAGLLQSLTLLDIDPSSDKILMLSTFAFLAPLTLLSAPGVLVLAPSLVLVASVLGTLVATRNASEPWSDSNTPKTPDETLEVTAQIESPQSVTKEY